MSALSALAGMFPPSANDNWNSNILWQPIPVHTVSFQPDYLFTVATCQKLISITSKYRRDSYEVRSIFSEYANEIKYWEKMSGLNLTSTYDIYKLYDTLCTEKEQNKRFVNFEF